ncbi:hypothetical protein HYU07_00265 [Candidatus Woesearchaeota archaeon]|nr:hypothetical protein [Candidatus Woesearchaeota archaeon]
MKIDFVFPSNNEKEFIEIAEKLDYDELYFTYKNQKDAANLEELQKNTKIKLNIALIQHSKRVKKEDGATILVKAAEDNRYVLEKTKADIVFAFEETGRRDFIHHRDSGLNHILCAIAKEKGKTIGFSFTSILRSEGMLRAQIIGRMMQNIELCRKYKVSTMIASFAASPYEMRGWHDLKSFFELLS